MAAAWRLIPHWVVRANEFSILPLPILMKIRELVGMNDTVADNDGLDTVLVDGALRLLREPIAQDVRDELVRARDTLVRGEQDIFQLDELNSIHDDNSNEDYFQDDDHDVDNVDLGLVEHPSAHHYSFYCKIIQIEQMEVVGRDAVTADVGNAVEVDVGAAEDLLYSTC